ncbi:hypothetical protein VMCG_09266 [Cytospora schulzeri]|uniref:Uncharacterized protein n=1 Tax=Cytospora schulzeri TaxID=448051 RepID=A0A423VKW8_9PEZI|nr:hypothetical protein VMCG_09266 [Valsa malicola]
MILWFKRRLLLRLRNVFAVFLVLYFFIYYLTSGIVVHSAASKYLGSIVDGVEQVFVANEPDGLELKKEGYVRAILDPEDTSTSRLACPTLNTERYDYLRVPEGERQHMYFFALDLREVVDLLPRLVGSAVEAMRFLGPHNSVLSVVEGNSDDGTWEVLSALRSELEALGITYFLRSSDINPGASEDRIGKLAELRSQALEPLRNNRNETARSLGLPGSELDFAEDATVVFLNDVAACTEDILELLHQRVFQEADMTCAMDWYYPGGRDAPSIFYDVWISRTLSGNLFFDIPDDGSWDKSDKLLPFDADARARLASHRPFQVFSCWNGAVTFTAKPLLDGRVDFRRVGGGECFQGEPQLLCKDMWFNGYGRIAVVPSVNLEYSDERGRWVKEDRGNIQRRIMDGRKPRVELVPWDFDSREHQARMHLQRLACGWRSEEVQKWVEQGREGIKTLYWIVIREELADKEALISQHVAAYPKANTAPTHWQQPREAATDRSFIPIGHIALDLREAQNKRLNITSSSSSSSSDNDGGGDGIVWVASLYISWALQRHGLGREVMRLAEDVAAHGPLQARWIVLDTMSREQQMEPALVQRVYLAQGNPAPVVPIQDWYEGQGYEAFAKEVGGYQWANPETGETQDIDYIFLKKRLG